jgi:hypothetical protein
MIKDMLKSSRSKIWLGSRLIIYPLIFLIFMQIERFDVFWYDRDFRIVEKHQGLHEHKGKPVFDYYVEVSYSDDKESNWVERVTGNKFFSYDVGPTYTKRSIRDISVYIILHVISVFFNAFGLCIHLFRSISRILIFNLYDNKFIFIWVLMVLDPISGIYLLHDLSSRGRSFFRFIFTSCGFYSGYLFYG